MEIIQKNQPHTLTLLLKHGNQMPVTNLQKTDLPVIKVIKHGSTVALDCTTHTITSPISGVYMITIPAGYMDVVGKVCFFIPDIVIGGTTLASRLIEREVVDDKFQTELHAKLDRILGLNQENLRITGHHYDPASGNLIQATIQTYRSKADLENTATNASNHLAKYEMNAEYDSNNNLTSYTVVKL